MINAYEIKRLLMTLALAGALTGTTNSFAKDSEAGFTISPMVGGYFPAQNRGLDDSTFVSLGLGYDFGNQWAFEFSYLHSEADIEGTSFEADLDLLRLDALYYFNQERLQPYLVLGVGEGEIEADFGFEEDDTMGNIGLGIRYAMTDLISFRSDVRLLHGMDSGESDYLAGLGLMFKFGGGTSSPAIQKKSPPLDSDKDGVVDTSDQCPRTPAGSRVNAVGCVEDVDTDRDGVVDAKDQCPDSEAGARVDALGCYEMLKEDVSVSLNVNFATNSDRVISDSFEDIEKVAQFLKTYPQTKVVIEGHTDSAGSATYNKDLSQRRAEAVAKILVEQYQVVESRVSAVGYGEDRPLVSNDTAENRAKNRRVTAVVSAVVEKVIK